MDLAVELQKIYDSEINIDIAWVWDGGIDVRLGDRINGYLAKENVKSVSDVIPWLQEAIAHFYPQSEYAASWMPRSERAPHGESSVRRRPAQGPSVRIAVTRTLRRVWMN